MSFIDHGACRRDAGCAEVTAPPVGARDARPASTVVDSMAPAPRRGTRRDWLGEALLMAVPGKPAR